MYSVTFEVFGFIERRLFVYKENIVVKFFSLCPSVRRAVDLIVDLCVLVMS